MKRLASLKQFPWTSYKRLLIGFILMLAMVVTAMPAAALAQTPAAIANQSFVAAAVRRVGPAVVRIDTEKTITRPFPSHFYY